VNKPAWPQIAPKAQRPPADPAISLLEQLAVAIERGASIVFRGRAFASHEAPIRASWSCDGDARAAHAWHSDAGDGLDVWCVVDDRSVRVLLELVLGGPGALKPTALERGIIRETVERLLSSCNRIWEERGAAAVSTNRGWQCRAAIITAGGARADVTLLAPAFEDPPRPAPARVDLRNVPMTLTAYVPAIDVRVGSILSWQCGTVIELRRDANAPVSLCAGSMPIGAGRLGIVRGRRALKLGPRDPEIRA
jgi:flagellar motor switch/type III secretory pathway protein FliN